MQKTLAPSLYSTTGTREKLYALPPYFIFISR